MCIVKETLSPLDKAFVLFQVADRLGEGVPPEGVGQGLGDHDLQHAGPPARNQAGQGRPHLLRFLHLDRGKSIRLGGSFVFSLVPALNM